MEHIKLLTIKRQLQERMHYPLTREEAGEDLATLDEVFDKALYGWAKAIVRQGSKYFETYLRDVILKRGWMSEKHADSFTDYIIPGWRII